MITEIKYNNFLLHKHLTFGHLAILKIEPQIHSVRVLLKVNIACAQFTQIISIIHIACKELEVQRKLSCLGLVGENYTIRV